MIKSNFIQEQLENAVGVGDVGNLFNVFNGMSAKDKKVVDTFIYALDEKTFSDYIAIGSVDEVIDSLSTVVEEMKKEDYDKIEKAGIINKNGVLSHFIISKEGDSDVIIGEYDESKILMITVRGEFEEFADGISNFFTESESNTFLKLKN